ncbi:MAG: PQ-loop repeat-containing protein [Betaproteobacteria bacterium]|nr:PQ-loop repeat-containing protein [Betaproteobacteria bacterium]NDF20336.1 PQ-loop repeat-containing protein [Betaproteobacteria bacterium]
MLDIIGWLGGLMLAFSAVPQALESYRCKNSNGLTWPFLMMWFLGEVFMIVYIVPKGDIILIANYAINLFLVAIILRYKIWPVR